MKIFHIVWASALSLNVYRAPVFNIIQNYILVSYLDDQVWVINNRGVFGELLVGNGSLLELLCDMKTHTFNTHTGKNSYRCLTTIFHHPTSCDLPVVSESSTQRDGNMRQVSYVFAQTVYTAVHPTAGHWLGGLVGTAHSQHHYLWVTSHRATASITEDREKTHWVKLDHCVMDNNSNVHIELTVGLTADEILMVSFTINNLKSSIQDSGIDSGHKDWCTPWWPSC